MDPKRRPGYRREFVQIVKELEPLDVRVLPYLRDATQMSPNRLKVVSDRVQEGQDLVELSFRNLLKLGLVESAPADGNLMSRPMATALGRQLLALVSD
jgi:hypothetical protein